MIPVSKVIIISLLVSSCATLNPQPKIPLMSGEAQAVRLLKCASLNLDFQVKYNMYSEVVDITCKPKFGYDYVAPDNVLISPVQPKPILPSESKSIRVK